MSSQIKIGFFPFKQCIRVSQIHLAVDFERRWICAQGKAERVTRLYKHVINFNFIK